MSRIFASSTSLTQFAVSGPLPGNEDMFQFIAEALQKFAFQPIDNSAEPVSTGWVQADDVSLASFENPGSLWIDNYLFFSLRQDTRRIPAAVLKAEMKKEEEKYLKANPNMRRLPKLMREEKKELVTARLLAKSLAAPSIHDVVWDLKTGIINLFSNSNKALELFDSYFRKTFPGFSLKMVVPYSRAEQICSPLNLADRLAALNQSATDSIVSLIRDNVWIGQDFLLWLLAGSADGSTSGFSAWIDSRLVMVGQGGEGTQKIAITGDVADRLPTIRAALQDGKRITSATVHFETNEGALYRFTMAADTFIINGFKTPIALVTEAIDDSVNEFQAALLEKTHLINTGMGYFHNLLQLFFEDRLLEDRWLKRLAVITEWMGEN